MTRPVASRWDRSKTDVAHDVAHGYGFERGPGTPFGRTAGGVRAGSHKSTPSFAGPSYARYGKTLDPVLAALAAWGEGHRGRG